ncbi:MAG: tRNA (adenosine(37)-N6)-threonylcarbamoyltransferase complex dimerization subunit type 1 TsaB [Clostridiales bacterium]|nr:tRNA (adenosine(37)-N6)-threonylcarbamoyltransferase complex dimerization subunit type 1 TsaB [Clostridiales bacterium]
MLLAIDTTAAVATAALYRDGALVAEREADATKKHAETALPLIDALLEECGVPISQIDLFAVDIGPGSFTGVRIGVSLVNALAFATGRQIVPVDALHTLALSAGDMELPVCAMIDARNGNAYAALYRAGETLIEPCAVEIEPFLSRVPEGAVFVGDAHAAMKSYPRARFVGLAALAMQDKALDEAEPTYLRPPQAERLRKKTPVKEA